MKNTIENEDNENEDSHEADSESFVTLSEKEEEKISNKNKIVKKQSNWDTTTKKYKADYEPVNDDERKLSKDETIEKKAVEKSPKERFVRFDEVLGNGSFKRVYKAYDFDDGKEVAWNVINVGNMGDEEIKKIIDEINLIKKLKNPRILNYISGWVNDEKKEVVFITDIFSGGSLKQYLTKIKYPRLKVIKHWSKEILKGLEYLHEQANPIIHRDIKCDNIFIDKNDGKITIGDLGYSCVLKNDYANSFSGTPEFMAPEVFESKYNIAADVYSFGMCLLEMITQEKPYKECDNIWKIYTAATQGQLPKALNRICHEKLKDLIKRCLKKENERPTVKELLASEFLNDMESEENNYPVPIYDEDCKYIINHESFEATSSTSLTLTKLKSQSDDKKSANTETRRDSFLNDKNKLADFRSSNLKNSPLIGKKPSGQKIEERLSLNNNAQTQDSKSTKPTHGYNKQSSIGIVSPITSKKNIVSPQRDNGFFHSSSESDKNNKMKKIVKSSNHVELTNPFFKKSKQALHQVAVGRPVTVKENNANAPNGTSFSKLELYIDTTTAQGKELKQDPGKIFIALKIKKPSWKNKKNIKFEYNLKIDTVEKVVSELKNQRQLNLTDEETNIIMEKLSAFIKQHKPNNSLLQESSKKGVEETHVQIEKKKLTSEKFFSKYDKLVSKAQKLLNKAIDKEFSSLMKNNPDFIDKIVNLRNFIQGKKEKNGTEDHPSKESLEKKEVSIKKTSINSPQYINK